MYSGTKKLCPCKIKKNIDTKNYLIRDYCNKFMLTQIALLKVQQAFLIELKNGLGKKSHENADVKCHITYVTNLPDGSERGKYLAIDLGGEDLRIFLIDLLGEGRYEINSKIYIIPPVFITGNGDKLFDYVTDCLADFISINNLKEYNKTIGFTFSFPVNQYDLESGVLTRWTKNFNCSGVIGKNVVNLLKQALKKKDSIKITTIALLNDTTGTLLSCALENQNSRIGVIVGLGCNACYLENVSNVENWDSTKSNSTHVVINTEFGAFGENGCIDFIRTDMDKYLDAHSVNAGEQIFEKLVSGLYLGEIVRITILQLVREKLLFNGNGSDVLEKLGGFKTVYLSEIESEIPDDYTHTELILKEMRLLKYATNDDYKNLLYICQCISRRSAQLIAALISTLINKINEKNITIAIDGSLYRIHPHYHNILENTIHELINPGISFNLKHSEDGSGKGAAVIAATVANLN